MENEGYQDYTDSASEVDENIGAEETQDVKADEATQEVDGTAETETNTEAQQQEPTPQQKKDINFSKKLLEMKRQQQQGFGKPAGSAPQVPPNPVLQNNPALMQQIAPVIAPFVAPLAQQIQQQQEQLMQVQMQAELAKVRTEHEDFDEVAPAIPELFESTPELFNLPNPIEHAYWIARSQLAERKLKDVYTDAQKAAYNSKAAKQKAVTETQVGKTPETKKTPEEQIAEEILAVGKADGSIF